MNSRIKSYDAEEGVCGCICKGIQKSESIKIVLIPI